jgi:hypothetical protein
VTYYADLEADLRLNAATDRPWYPLGASAIVTATLSTRTSGADVRARLQWLGDGTSPRGSPTDFKLLSEGEPGNYGETIPNLTRAGYYLLRVTARGQGYARERETLFAVSPNTARFSGSARAHVEGTPGNYSALVVEAPVNVDRAGAFALGVSLQDSKGLQILALTAPLTLAQGAQTASLTIPGRDLRARGIDGPFTLALTLMDTTWAAVPLEENRKALTTEAWRANDFRE